MRFSFLLLFCLVGYCAGSRAGLLDAILHCEGGAAASCAAVSAYNTSGISDMSFLFANTRVFNHDISAWDISSVTSMHSMFRNSSFNHDVCPWGLQNRPGITVTDMFAGGALEAFASTGGCPVCDIVMPWGSPCLQTHVGDCTESLRCLVRGCCVDGVWVCGADISRWDVSSVPGANGLFSAAGGFECAGVFDANLSGWDVSHMTEMDRMFEGNLVFNGDISTWDVGALRSARRMFMGALSFAGDLSGWRAPLLESTHRMFMYATAFNGDISLWATHNINDMSLMFFGASSFSGDLSRWDTSRLTSMAYMFFNASSFGGSLCDWGLAPGSLNITQAFSGTQLSERDIYACAPTYSCPSGEESNGLGGCSACLSGSYKATSGTGWCERCWKGSIAHSVLGPCVYECVCQPGYYLGEGGGCAACPTNTYKATYGNDLSCATCPLGLFSEPGSASCVCVPGTFADSDNK